MLFTEQALKWISLKQKKKKQKRGKNSTNFVHYIYDSYHRLQHKFTLSIVCFKVKL